MGKYLQHTVTLCLSALLVAVGVSGCDEPQMLTKGPMSMDIYVDATFSNDQVAEECLDDVMTAAKLAAGSRGYLSFHTFDGDPFHRRGVSKSFDEGVPADREHTSTEIAWLEEQADKLRGQFKRLIAEPPTVGGTPLLPLLERAAGSGSNATATQRILICTDGLFTDVNPRLMTAAEAREEGKELGPGLRGVDVDFIGLDGSEPERGRWIERIKPLARALVGAAGAQFDTWRLELPSDWRNRTIEEIDMSFKE